MKHPESILQRSIVAYLRAVLPRTVRAFAIPNGLHATKKAAARAVGEGLTAGVPDIALVRQGGSVAFLELKSAKGKLSPAQAEWLDWCGANGIEAAVVRSIDDVRGFLKTAGIDARELL